MSDFKSILRANFINRRTGSVISSVPISNNISLNLDMRQFTDSFDFDFLYKRNQNIDLRSHDFVEFFFKDQDSGIPFQVSCGFIETITSDTGPTTHRYQANGRDFLGQLFNLPFLVAKPFDNISLIQFARFCLQGSYLETYFKYKGLQQLVVDRGVYPGNILIPELTDAKRGPVLQQTADAVYNAIYMDRFGRMNIYGNSNRLQFSQSLNNILSEFGDRNVESMQLRRDYSKVFSEVKVLYTGGENNVNYALQQGAHVYNSDPDAANIFNPEIRTFQTGDLITTAPGNNEIGNRMNLLAASIVRKGNQNLRQFVVKTNQPFYVDSKGVKTWYEKGQVWKIYHQSQNFNDQMMLAGIGYVQDAEKLSVQLLFVPVASIA